MQTIKFKMDIHQCKTCVTYDGKNAVAKFKGKDL